MEKQILNFIQLLRNNDVRISTSEAIDVFNTFQIIGIEKKEDLKNALIIVLAKSKSDVHRVDIGFDYFFPVPHTKSNLPATPLKIRKLH